MDNIGAVLERNYELFLSYRRSDGKYLAKLISKYLTELGYTLPFFDFEAIPGGVNWEKTIESVIPKCKDFILLITRDTFENLDSYIIREIECALEHNVHILPLLCDGAVFPSEDILPERIRGLKSISAARLELDLQRRDEDIVGSLRSQFGQLLRTEPKGSVRAAPDINPCDDPRLKVQAENLKEFDRDQLEEICCKDSMQKRAGNITVLDIGCGDGSLGMSRFKSEKYVKVVGVDFDSKKINKANRRLKKYESCESTPDYERGKYHYFNLDVDASSRRELERSLREIMNKLEIEDGFDIIYAANILHMIRNQNVLLSALYRILKPGGYIFTRCPDDRMKMADGDDGLLGKIIEGTKAMNIRADREAGGKQYNWLTGAGFRDVRIKVFFRSTDGMDDDCREKLFEESYRWRRDIAQEHSERPDCDQAHMGRTCRALMSDIDDLCPIFNEGDNFWYCEADIVAIGTKQ